jgi:hypothetical protein
VTGRYLRAQQQVGVGPLGASLASDGQKDEPLFNTFTFDAGAAVQLSEQFRLALSGRNLTAPGTGLAPVVLAGGLGWSNQTVTIEADALVDFTTWSTSRARGMLGIEVLAADRFPLRAGYRADAGMKTQSVSLGLGYVDKKWSLEFGGRRDIVADRPATFVSLGLRFFIDAGAAGAGDSSETF